MRLDLENLTPYNYKFLVNEFFSTYTLIDSVISVPPTCIEKLPEETRFLSDDEDLSLTCQVKEIGFILIVKIDYFRLNAFLNSPLCGKKKQ